MDSAISLGVFCRAAPSTSAIIRSMKLSPGLVLIRTTIRSDNTVVPPVTAHRSPPDSRMTGAVSYTHLDVYKRQVLPTTRPSRSISDPLAIGRATTCATPVNASGQTIPSRTVSSKNARRAAPAWRADPRTMAPKLSLIHI